jgi:hypothetical protein
MIFLRKWFASGMVYDIGFTPLIIAKGTYSLNIALLTVF